MNHYLLMGHLLRCNVIPADEVHPELWVGANKKWRQVPRARLEKVRQDKVSRENSSRGDQLQDRTELTIPIAQDTGAAGACKRQHHQAPGGAQAKDQGCWY
jgi:hypothetical protein